MIIEKIREILLNPLSLYLEQKYQNINQVGTGPITGSLVILLFVPTIAEPATVVRKYSSN